MPLLSQVAIILFMSHFWDKKLYTYPTMPKSQKMKNQQRKRKNPTRNQRMVIPRGLAARELEIVRTVETLVTVASGNGALYGLNGTSANNLSFSFALSQLNIYIGATSNSVNIPNYTEFVALFDQFCIKKVDMIAFYNVNTSTNTGGAVTTASLPVFALVDDYTDSGVLASMGDALQYGNCKLIQFGNERGQVPGVRHSLSPRPGIDVNTYGVATSALVPKGTVWLDTQAATTPHFAIKMYYDNWSAGGITTQQGEIQFFFQFTFGFKQPK